VNYDIKNAYGFLLMNALRFLPLRSLVSVTALLATASAVVAQPITKDVKDEVLSQVHKLVTENAYAHGADFTKWPEMLESQNGVIDEAKDQKEFVAAVNAALKKFGFSHIVLSTPAAAAARRDRAAVGIGITIQPEEGGLRVIATFPNAPAENAGIRVGDLIFEVDGKKPEGPSPIAGEVGTQVTIKVKRDDDVVHTFEITRAKFSTDRPETLTWLDKKTAILKIPTFDLSYNADRVDKLMQEAGSADYLILDLRSNGGGAVLHLQHLLGHLLPTGAEIGTFIDKRMFSRYLEETKGDPNDLAAIGKWSRTKVKPFTKKDAKPFRGRIAVLINGGTGSASEMVAAAMRELNDSPIIGTKSAGAVLASVMLPLPHQFQLQLPLRDYVTIRGVRLEGNGIEPDVVVEMPRYNEPDTAIEKAVAVLMRAQLREQRQGDAVRR
jgi:carboxyl-terminal processing protease